MDQLGSPGRELLAAARPSHAIACSESIAISSDDLWRTPPPPLQVHAYSTASGTLPSGRACGVGLRIRDQAAWGTTRDTSAACATSLDRAICSEP